MTNKYLSKVYNTIFEETFEYSEFEKRLEMQKMVYLLQNLGTSIGDYGFRWYKHGPYSQALLDDMYLSEKIINDIHFSNDALKNINIIKDLIKQRNNYTTAQWLECLASILFIKKNVLSSTATKEQVIEDLMNKKSHLNKKSDNNLAYKLIDKYFL